MFQNIIVKGLLVAGVFVVGSQQALGENSQSCSPLRMGQAKVEVSVLRYVQEKGSYRFESKVVCKQDVPLEVRVASKAACMTPVLLNCNLELDGKPHLMRVSGEIRIHEGANPVKIFSGSYHVDRNTTEVQSGEASHVSTEVEDLHFKKLRLDLQSKLDGPTPGRSTRDSVNVKIDFEDTHVR